MQGVNRNIPSVIIVFLINETLWKDTRMVPPKGQSSNKIIDLVKVMRRIWLKRHPKKPLRFKVSCSRLDLLFHFTLGVFNNFFRIA